jgi:pimeloyl-ACP methyl ester carboxylesterase
MQYVPPMEARTRTLELPGDRQLCLAAGGDPGGYPVIGLHGEPGCRHNRWPDDGVYAAAGVLYVTTDRAGYGQSTRQAGRQVADEAADVLAVADALGLERFGVIGSSGGGPYALACAALLSGRVERAACLSGLAPFGDQGLAADAWLAGMNPGAVREVEWAQAGETVLLRELADQQRQIAEQLSGGLAALFGDEISAADRAYLARPEVIQVMERVVAEQAAHGVYGWADDSLAFIAPWGFAPGTIDIPVLITYGLADGNVPPAHGAWLAAHVRTATTVVSAAGHIPADPVAEIAEHMAWLRHGTVPAA